MLNIVSTPIGNLKDITIRAIEALGSCDAIICEDTRRTNILLNHFNISKPLIILNDYNEANVYPKIITKLKSGQNLSLVSDAGTPLISDPGFKLVRECLSQNIPVDSIPGPSSVITALTLSALPPDKFMFLGYFPEKQGKRLKLLLDLQKIAKILPTTFIFFVAPLKLKKPLEEIKSIFGDIEITLALELTKLHQRVEKKTISTWLIDFSKKSPRGEITLLLSL